MNWKITLLIGIILISGCIQNEKPEDICECPQYTPPAPNFCENGTIVPLEPMEKNGCICPRPPSCEYD